LTEIQIAAVGDLMVKRYIISDAKLADGTYSFDPLLAKVAPILKQADLTIGNLETTFAGTRGRERLKHAVLCLNVLMSWPRLLTEPVLYGFRHHRFASNVTDFEPQWD
jgi:hypothetical protein